MPEHYYEKKIYYHDTDAGNVVYYARYLEHLEEARTEFWRHNGVDVAALAAQGIIFPVVRLEVDYKAPARYGETVRVYTRPEKVGNASIHFIQEIRRGEVMILIAKTVWACVTKDLKVRRIPDEMRRLVLIACAVAVLCAAAIADAYAADVSREFSADVVTTENGRETTGKVFVAKDKARTELADTIVITRADKNKSWIFIPKEHVYIERPIDRKFVTAVSGVSANEIARESLGAEMVAGKRAEKYKVTYKDAVGQAVIFQWIADDIGAPVRTSAADGRWVVEYRNVKIAPVDPQLFEIPEGYVPAEKPATAPELKDYAEWNDE